MGRSGRGKEIREEGRTGNENKEGEQRISKCGRETMKNGGYLL